MVQESAIDMIGPPVQALTIPTLLEFLYPTAALF